MLCLLNSIMKMRLRLTRSSVPLTKLICCPEYNATFPPPNYLPSCGTPSGKLWLDGRRHSDGTVKQWLLSDEVSESSAAQRIGVGNITFTIRFALFELKPEHRQRRIEEVLDGSRGAVLSKGAFESSRAFSMGLHISDGVEIDQAVYPDEHQPEHWEESPSVVVILNYVAEQYLLSLLEHPQTAAAQWMTANAQRTPTSGL